MTKKTEISDWETLPVHAALMQAKIPMTAQLAFHIAAVPFARMRLERRVVRTCCHS